MNERRYAVWFASALLVLMALRFLFSSEGRALFAMSGILPGIGGSWLFWVWPAVGVIVVAALTYAAVAFRRAPRTIWVVALATAIADAARVAVTVVWWTVISAQAGPIESLSDALYRRVFTSGDWVVYAFLTIAFPVAMFAGSAIGASVGRTRAARAVDSEDRPPAADASGVAP